MEVAKSENDLKTGKGWKNFVNYEFEAYENDQNSQIQIIDLLRFISQSKTFPLR